MNNYKSEDLVGLLKKKYITDDGAYNPSVILEQVPNGTGGVQSRWIDVAVFEMWKTKGLTRSAFEIKVSRSDFIAELSNPLKHQWCKECFHYFWFVAPKDVIQLEELPHGVGWMYPKGGKLAVARHAIKNESPKLDDYLLAAFMRAAHKMIKKTEQITSREVMANDPEHQRAMRYMKATIQFLNSRGKNSFLLDDSEDYIIEALEDATMDKQLLQDSFLFNLAWCYNPLKRMVGGLANEWGTNCLSIFGYHNRIFINNAFPAKNNPRHSFWQLYSRVGAGEC